MRSIGIDIGSRAIKLVLLEGDQVLHTAVEDTGSDPLGVCRRLLEGHRAERMIATGYGRLLFKEHWAAAEVIAEIKALALGASALVSGCRTIIDIGGQDTKAIALNSEGKVHKFMMNDRCAAGTGQFLEIMATTLGYSREEFITAATSAERAEPLSSMCSVFAQSEVISLMARGAAKEELALGVHQAVAHRMAAQAGRLSVIEPVLFTGGCAHNPCLRRLISHALKRVLRVPESPQTVAALGCALHGAAEKEPTHEH
jgi:predicted CoA-substrate-specific enzyme activase